MEFLGMVVRYMVQFVLTGAVAVLGIMLGSRLRMNKDAKKAIKEEK